jgi:hypothetical protein
LIPFKGKFIDVELNAEFIADDDPKLNSEEEVPEPKYGRKAGQARYRGARWGDPVGPDPVAKHRIVT